MRRYVGDLIFELQFYFLWYHPVRVFDVNDFTKFNLNHQDFLFRGGFLADLYERPDLRVPDCLKSRLIGQRRTRYRSVCQDAQ